MSTGERLLRGVRDVLLLTERISRLDDDLRRVSDDVKDHERRLIRIETLIEVAGARGSAARLTGPDDV